MVFNRGSGSSGPKRQGTTDDEIRRIIAAEVTAAVKEFILEVLRSIKITMIEMFGERYVAVEGCFYTCSCQDDLRVRYALNLLLLGEKFYWKFVTTGCSSVEPDVVTWDRFVERLAHEYLSLR